MGTGRYCRTSHTRTAGGFCAPQLTEEPCCLVCSVLRSRRPAGSPPYTCKAATSLAENYCTFNVYFRMDGVMDGHRNNEVTCRNRDRFPLSLELSVFSYGSRVMLLESQRHFYSEPCGPADSPFMAPWRLPQVNVEVGGPAESHVAGAF